MPFQLPAFFDQDQYRARLRLRLRLRIGANAQTRKPGILFREFSSFICATEYQCLHSMLATGPLWPHDGELQNVGERIERLVAAHDSF
jgi:hypothetical protein